MAEPPTSPDVSVPFHYLKSNHFRVVFAEGAVGGPTPRGHLAFALYNERQAIPRQTAIDFKDMQPSPERYVEGRQGMVREVEVEVIMDVTAAEAFHEWFGNKLDEMKELIARHKA